MHVYQQVEQRTSPSLQVLARSRWYLGQWCVRHLLMCSVGIRLLPYISAPNT
jgi:hypothetical protein